MPLPAWVARTVQVPTAPSVTVVPATVQMDKVVEAKLTVKFVDVGVDTELTTGVG